MVEQAPPLYEQTLPPPSYEEALSEDDVKNDVVEVKKIKIEKRNKPKKNINAFMFFCIERRPKIREENPDMNARDIMKILGDEWKEIKNTKMIIKYTNQANKDKERYKKEMDSYVG